MHLLLPGDALYQDVAVGRDALVLRVLDLEILGEIGLEPGAELGAKGGMFGRVGEIHGVSSLSETRIAGLPPCCHPGGSRDPSTGRTSSANFAQPTSWTCQGRVLHDNGSRPSPG